MQEIKILKKCLSKYGCQGNIQLIGPKNVTHSCCRINLRRGQSVCVLGETKRKARRRRSDMLPLCSQEKVSINSIEKEFVLRFF